MSSTVPSESSAVKRALVELREMRGRLDAFERARSEPIAITGMGMRLPGGVATCAEYWDLLREGRDAVTEVPRERWDIDRFHDPDPDAPGKIATRYGGFLDRVDEFDARFFGITPREAVSMDPQQRLLLEVAWEALEHAGQAPDRLNGQAVGVFVGLSSTDYLTTELKFSPATDIDAYLATGGHPSVASGRLSYVLGLQGPSLTVDTACSSSLAAVHLAAQSLRAGECRMALAGGVSLMLMPELSVNFSRARMMAPDGRCKTFDSRADGYVRSEGCGVLVLKRLTEALADGDRVLAVVRGSALNQDGRSSGLTVPNGPAQEAVIREALRRAGVRPSEVDYVEAHGTGTALGDPVELRALGQVFCEGRQTGPLVVGSVKTNVGHLEAAAGVAGLIKVVLALQHEVIPPHIHMQEPTRHVDWARLALVVPTETREWRRGARVRVAGVSAFGFSGTNAHVVLAEAPVGSDVASLERDRPLHLLTVSAKSAAALRQTAERLSAHVGTSADAIADICYTANVGRAHGSERAAALVGSIEDARAALAAMATGGEHPAVITSSIADSRRLEVAFLFAGQGTQYVGMGRGLFDTQPVFRHTLLTCEEMLRQHLDRPLLEVLYPRAGQSSPIDETIYAQPVLFAFEYALAEMWRSWGVEPTLVLGHSLGEDVAACVAGVFGLEEGLAMVAARARVMESSLTAGAMASVFAPEHRVRAYLANESPQIEIAAFNGPHHVVISGPAAAVADAVTRLEAEGVKVRPLTTNRACHSALMDPALDEIEQLAARMTLARPHLGLVSTLTGRMAGAAEVTDARYWRRHVREAVRFTEAIQTLYDQGVRLCVEMGPNGTLTGMARRILAVTDAHWLPSLKRDEEWTQVLTTLGTLHTRGVPIEWAEFDRGYGRRKITLPASPFERVRYWSDSVRPRTPEPHAVRWTPLGYRIYSPALTGTVYQSQISVAAWSALADHRVEGRAVAPAALFAEMALAAGGTDAVSDLRISEPLVLDDEKPRTLQLVLSPADATFAIVSASIEDNGLEPRWLRHATGTLTQREGIARSAETPVDREAIVARCTERTSAPDFYAHLDVRRLTMGPAFRAIRQVFHGDGEALGEIEVPAAADDLCAGWRVHPVLVDAACQVAAAVFPEILRSDAYLMVGFSRLTVWQHSASRAWSHVLRCQSASDDALAADVVLFDDDGGLVAEIEGLGFRRASGSLAATDTWTSNWLHEVVWRERPRASASAHARPAAGKRQWLVLADATGVGDALAHALSASGYEPRVLRQYGTPSHLSADARIDPADPSAFDAVVASAAGSLAGCVNLWSLDAPRLDEATDALERTWSAGCLGGLHLVRALLRASVTAPVWTVTRSAIASGTAYHPDYPAQATVWGLGRVVSLEHPELWGGLIDLQVDDVAAGAHAILEEALGPDGEDQIVVQRGRRLVARLAASAGPAAADHVGLRADGSYLVIGGLGRIGLDLARWLASRGARHLTLVSRRGLPDRSRWNGTLSREVAAGIAAIRSIEALGAEVTVAAADVTDAGRMAEVFDAFGRTMPPLRGVVHAATGAGAVRVADLTAAELGAMLSSKLTGAVVLQRLCEAHDLDFFVLFSSVSGVLGSAVLGHYAAANAFLDSFAAAHRSDACPITSVAWGAWERLDLSSDELRRATEGAGLRRMPVARALDAFGRLLRPHAPHVVLVDADWTLLRSVYEARRQRPMLEELGQAPAELDRATRRPAVSDMPRRLERARAADRPAILLGYVLHQAADVLRIAADDLDPHQGLFDLGMDSLMSAELKGRLETGLALALPATLAFNHPSVAAIAAFLAQRLFGSASEDGPSAVTGPVENAAAAAVAGLDGMSEDELAVLLAGRLTELR